MGSHYQFATIDSLNTNIDSLGILNEASSACRQIGYSRALSFDSYPKVRFHSKGTLTESVIICDHTCFFYCNLVHLQKLLGA